MLSRDEIDTGKLNTDDGTDPLQKIYDCLMTDGELLTDGETIDMCIAYINTIKGEQNVE